MHKTTFIKRWIFSGVVVLSFQGIAYAQSTLDKQIEELGLNIQQPEISVEGGATKLSTESSGSAAVNSVSNEIRVLLKPQRTTLLSAEATGQIKSFPNDIGDRFKKGAALVKIGCSDTYSEIAIAKSRVAQSRLEYESNKSLLAQGGVSKFDLDISGAGVEEREAILKKYQGLASGCVLTAPYSGKVVATLASRYEYVNKGTPVVEIIEDSVLDMQLYVPSTWVTKLSTKTEFTVYIDEVKKSYPARVIRVNPRVDAGSKTVEIIAQLTEQHKELRAGMSGSAKFNF
ncbi:MAG: efflux RND transporter periplasmic adaptor subunit [Acidiferrobacterales bacterium]|nr:efflux RND transporter periplasmic adaptor subunit [Acidiferrobacterales bacterium]